MRLILRLLATLGSLAVLAARADDNCQAQTPLEISYCTLVARGASGLPALYEFRKNTADTQYLLLKRPAAKHGVTLPAPTRKTAPPKTSMQPSAPEPDTAATLHRSAPPAARPSVASTFTSTQSTAGCQLAHETISCGAQRFALQWNQPKKALQAEALGPGNRLIFPPEPKNPAAQNDYLQRCFTQYVQKMLLIGLGNTTLSFDKFAAIYATAKTERFDFAARFERMYHFLKEERKTLQPPKGFGHRPPAQLEDCQPISDSLWSCQTAEQHWVYARI